jgi:hypothetical protein
MGKSSLSKFKDKDYWDEEEGNPYISKSRYLEKKKQKLVQRALKTKDISILTTEEFEDLDDDF